MLDSGEASLILNPSMLRNFWSFPFLVALLTASIASATPVNVALNRPARADSFFGSALPEYAVDGEATSTASRWLSADTPAPHWLELDLGQSYQVSRLWFKTGNTNGPFPLDDFALQQWTGSGWSDVLSVTDSPVTGDTVDLSFDPLLVSNRVRLWVAGLKVDNTVRLYELQLDGEPHGLTVESLGASDTAPALDPAAPITVTFSAPVQLGVTTGVRIEDLAAGTDLTGVSTTVSGAVLSLTHPELVPGQSYAVHLPQGTVVLAADGTTPNGAFSWAFPVAPVLPQFLGLNSSLPDLNAPIELTFDRPLTLLNPAAISVERVSDGAPLAGIVPTVSGPTLSLAHAPLVAEELYLVRLAAGAVAGQNNGLTQQALRAVVFAGSVTLVQTDFDTGLEGFQLARDIPGTVPSSATNWAWTTTQTAIPGDDLRFLTQQTLHAGDFAASPAIGFLAGAGYLLEGQVLLNTDLTVELGTSPALAGASPLLTVAATGGFKNTIRHQFTAEASGTRHLLFSSGVSGVYHRQCLDQVTLRRALPPLVRFLNPAPGATLRESDAVTVSIEAVAVDAEVASIAFYDNGFLLGSPAGTGGLYTFDWSYHPPGHHTLRVEVTDSWGLVTVREMAAVVTFDDGTPPPGLIYTFDQGTDGWTRTDGTPISRFGDSAGRPGSSLRYSTQASQKIAASSPLLYLSAGQTYTLTLKAFTTSGGGPFTFGFLPTATPGYPSNTTEMQTFVVSRGPTDWSEFNLPFTVPANGAYHLTIFYPKLTGFITIQLDDIGLSGPVNLAPTVTLTAPATDITTIAGATVQLAASATDSDGSVSEVSFRTAAGTLVAPDATDTTEPFSYAWTGLPEGQFDVLARAVDDFGAFGQSSVRQVTAVANHLDISTYLGGPSDENFTAACYLTDGTLVLGGIADPALFPGVTPAYVNGATAGDRGIIVRLSGDGRTVLSVTVVGAEVSDLDTDGVGRIYVAAMADGALAIDASGQTVLWSQTYAGRYAHRVDAGDGGTFAVLTSSNSDFRDRQLGNGVAQTYAPGFAFLGAWGGAGHYTNDLAVDETSGNVIVAGWRNYTSMPDDSSLGTNPVDIPILICRRLTDGAEQWRAYDWGLPNDPVTGNDRFLNRVANNMADTRIHRVVLHEDKLYVAFEYQGGNTPLRYDPFDLDTLVNVVGGDQYHANFNSNTEPKTFIGRYSAATGAFETGQWLVNRLSSGAANTIRIENGGLAVDSFGRVHLVGECASGLPLTHDPLPGGYNGGGWHMVLSPDLGTREFVTRLSSGGDCAAVAISPSGQVAIVGRTDGPLFPSNAVQTALGGGFDAFYAVADYAPYYQYQPGEHPRLFFSAADLPAIRAKLGREPFASMLAELIAQRDFADNYRPYDPNNGKSLLLRVQASAFLYAVTGLESYALDARNDLEAAWEILGDTWDSPSTRALDLYTNAARVAIAYDLCANSPHWTGELNYRTSIKLRDLAAVIVDGGGSELNSELASNFTAARGASAGLALLATDHDYQPDWLTSTHALTVNYLNTNQGGSSPRGWNPEGFGYTAYPLGNFLGPYALAAKRNGAGDLTTHAGLQWMPWTGFAGATTALDVYGLGGVKTDWSDDNAHIGGEGTYGLAFAFAPASLQPGLKHAYDRLMGHLAPNPTWDVTRGGSFWSILYYPESILSQNPNEIWDWHRASNDSGGLGLFTFRDAYAGANDILVQFKAKLRNTTQSHDGPDGLGFRLIGLGNPFVVGGGRNAPGRDLNQATVYPVNPDGTVTTNRNTGTIVGTPLIKPDGGGHVIASMATSNVGTTSHKRWLVTDFDVSNTGAAAVVVVADTTANGTHWQLPTFLNNTITTDGSTFTISGANGASLRGTILHPGGTPVITVGTKARGEGYTLAQGGTLAAEDPVTNPRISENRYLHLQHGGDGDFLVVMTLSSTGTHPTVARLSGAVADAVVQVGGKRYALQPSDVLYGLGEEPPAAYLPPAVTVTFGADGKGTLNGMAPVQVIPYGGTAVAPTVTPKLGYAFAGWDKSLGPVVQSMEITARFDPVPLSFDDWINDPAYELGPEERVADFDADGDGWSNLLEYVLALNPALRDGTEEISLHLDGEEVAFQYRLRNDLVGVTVAPQHAAELAPEAWSDIPAAKVRLVESGPAFARYEVRWPVTVNSSFFRLEIVEPPPFHADR